MQALRGQASERAIQPKRMKKVFILWKSARTFDSQFVGVERLVTRVGY